MRLADFDYSLPEELIAQEPLPQRSASRLMIVDRMQQQVRHARFADLPTELVPGDLLVRNETRVLPARLFGRKPTGGQVEVLLVQRCALAEEVWLCMTRSSKALRVGTRIDFPAGARGEIVDDLGEGRRLVRFQGSEDFPAYLGEHGRMPLPPYIRRDARRLDQERYQTVFARTPGAVAAPTAGLHFTSQTFEALRHRGIETCGITLHVGPGTFQPVRSETLEQHRMHAEWYEMPAETAGKIRETRAAGHRVIALGTTVTRTLEHCAAAAGEVEAGSGETDLFIRPGHQFRTVDGLVTNFHLPKSTLLVLVAAFAGRDLILRAYREAIAERYRFFSYGDCMLIL